jgi:hypothetical protein
LTLFINGTAYGVRPIAPGFAGVKAYQLKKSQGTVYHVVQTLDGSIECDCGDFEFRRRDLADEPCKHGAALLACGLFSTWRWTQPARKAEETAPITGGAPEQLTVRDWNNYSRWSISTEECSNFDRYLDAQDSPDQTGGWGGHPA